MGRRGNSEEDLEAFLPKADERNSPREEEPESAYSIRINQGRLKWPSRGRPIAVGGCLGEALVVIGKEV
jgi:hypothetical protein